MEKRLYRSRRERMISGVCGGIADYFAVDPTLVRIIWVLITLTSGGLGFLAYIAAIIIVPEEPFAVRHADAAATGTSPAGTGGGSDGAGETPAGAGSTAGEGGAAAPGAEGTTTATVTHTWSSRDTDRHSGRMIGGVVLVVVGGYFLLHNLLPHFFFLEGRFIWPVLVILVGLLVLTRGLQRRG